MMFLDKFNEILNFIIFGIIAMFIVFAICMFTFKHYVEYVKEINIVL